MDRSSIICRFFLNGNCRYDLSCRYSHTMPDTAEPVTQSANVRKWVDAPEFIPRNVEKGFDTKCQTNDYCAVINNQNSGTTIVPTNSAISYAEVLMPGIPNTSSNELCPYTFSAVKSADPFAICRYGERCPYQHGLLCDICGQYSVHPFDMNEQKAHRKVCLYLHTL